MPPTRSSSNVPGSGASARTPSKTPEKAAANGHAPDPTAENSPQTAVREVNTTPLEASNRELRIREAEEDRALIAKAQAGDPAERGAAFRQLVERHQRRAFAIAFGLV